MRSLHMSVLLVPALIGALAVAGQATAADSARTVPVKVKMTDYAFSLSKLRVPRGPVVFQVVNSGEVVHDFRIAGKKTPIFTTGQSGLLRVTFSRPGTYSFVCTVPGHIAAGMTGVLKVTR